MPIHSDSGYDSSTRFPDQLSLRLNFNTLAGNFVAYGHEVTLRAFGLTFDATVYFAESHSVTRNLLGRHGFLQNIQLGLCDHDELLYLSKYDELLT